MVYSKLFILLFADDTVLFGNNKEDLQLVLNIFNDIVTSGNHNERNAPDSFYAIEFILYPLYTGRNYHGVAIQAQ